MKMGTRNKKNNYEANLQIRISNELKEKATYKAGNGKLSDYVRKLIEEDCDYTGENQLIMSIVLRDYQEDIYNKIKIAFKNGSKGVLGCLPCRSRKVIYNGCNSRICK